MIFCKFTGTDRPALKYLFRYVKTNITTKWYDIGIELLNVEDESSLNTINCDHRNDVDKCTTEMLKLWLDKRSDASWNQLIQAFREPNIKLESLATKIESMLRKGMIAFLNLESMYYNVCMIIRFCAG